MLQNKEGGLTCWPHAHEYQTKIYLEDAYLGQRKVGKCRTKRFIIIIFQDASKIVYKKIKFNVTQADLK